MTEGVDFSTNPSGAAIAAAGKSFVVRYVPYGGQTKGLTAAQLADYRANNLAVALVMETTTQRALGGVIIPDVDDAYAASLGIARPAHITPDYAGAADAWYADTQVRALGFPANQPVYFAVDFDANVGQRTITATDPDRRDELAAYLRGAAGSITLARVGVYGSFWVVEWAFANGLVTFGWQTYAWSGGRVSARAQLYQYRNAVTLAGTTLDLDRSQAVNFGQWAPPLPDSSTGGDVDPVTQVPVGTVDVAPGGTVYADLASTQVLIPSWIGAKNVGAYCTAKRPDGHLMTLVRIDFGTGGSDLRAVWVGADKTSDPTPYGDADLLTAKRAGYDLAVSGAVPVATATIDFPPRP